jgi:carbon monoxide dehydrogenase subunit G
MQMTIADRYTFDAPAGALWEAIFDTETLRDLIPGCTRLDQTGPDAYHGEIRIGIAAVSGAYETDVTVAERDEPHYCRMLGEVSGPTGTMKGEARFTLEESCDQTTLIYGGKAIISGALGTMSPRFVEGVAQTLIRHGLGKLGKRVSAAQAAETD